MKNGTKITFQLLTHGLEKKIDADLAAISKINKDTPLLREYFTNYLGFLKEIDIFKVNYFKNPDKEIESKVNAVAYEAKTVNNVTTYVIDVLPEEKVDFLRSGMTANVTFYGEAKEDILVIPTEYIKYDSGTPKVTVKSDKKSEDREISIGISDGKRTEVKSGLTEAETIVLEIKKDTKAKSNMFSSAQPGGNRGSGSGGRR